MNVQHVSHVILQWNIMINPGISGSNCVGEKVRHLTTTLPQQVAAMGLNYYTQQCKTCNVMLDVFFCSSLCFAESYAVLDLRTDPVEKKK